MALESLLTLFDSDVSDVADVQASNGAASRCNGWEIRDVAAVAGSREPVTPASRATIPATAAATSATAEKIVTLQPKPAPLLGCTAATPATAENSNAECKAANQGAKVPDRDQGPEGSEWRHLQSDVAKRAALQGNTGAGSGCNGAATSATAETAQTDVGADNHRLWLITRPDGERFSLSRNPTAPLLEIQADYPGCTITPEPAPAPGPALSPDDLAVAHALLRHWQEDDLTTGNDWLDGLARDPARLEGMRQMALAAGVARYEPAPAPTTEPEDEPRPMAVCARCRHWTPDTINPKGGLGQCLIAAPASRRPGSCWPWTHDGAGIHCHQFEDTAHE
ncbi:hypothetical protein [Thiocystis violascens]|uniref:Uncharacterized protein n=1 Tax=Thiocystis violascens (strain ATCC 17096 / DSM 198 / 6111) TaxID=765911 RepID=I3Y9A4_THIV6|nr:hypothetical protein [Thiocystis violascens]AFL73572.1 hypothetical protein Thivi_1584 [Thiocystis violascens DSM 198]